MPETRSRQRTPSYRLHRASGRAIVTLVGRDIYLAVAGLRRGRTAARELPQVSRQIRAMIELQTLTGMRPGEVCIMRACDVDMSGMLWLYTPESHKTEHHGRSREIVLGPKAQATIRQFLTVDRMKYLFSPADAEAERLAERHRARKTPPRYGNRPGTNRKTKPLRQPRDHE